MRSLFQRIWSLPAMWAKIDLFALAALEIHSKGMPLQSDEILHSKVHKVSFRLMSTSCFYSMQNGRSHCFSTQLVFTMMILALSLGNKWNNETKSYSMTSCAMTSRLSHKPVRRRRRRLVFRAPADIQRELYFVSSPVTFVSLTAKV